MIFTMKNELSEAQIKQRAKFITVWIVTANVAFYSLMLISYLEWFLGKEYNLLLWTISMDTGYVSALILLVSIGLFRHMVKHSELAKEYYMQERLMYIHIAVFIGYIVVTFTG